MARWIEALKRLLFNATRQVPAPVPLRSGGTSQIVEPPSTSAHRQSESLTLIAGGLAHDFNNLLAGILGHADLAAALVPPHSAERMHLAKIAESARRAAELNGQLLAFAGKGRLLESRIDFNRLIERAADAIRAALPNPPRIELDLDPALPDGMGDENQIGQAIRNLVQNAIEARSTPEDTLTIRTRPHSPDPARSGAIRIEFADTGTGIDPAVFDRIFDPYFSTKAFGRGMGLAAVHGIVASHGGSISVASAAGRGTTFTVILPAVMARETVPETSLPPLDAAPSSERRSALIIDDEETVRLLVVQMLQKFGWEVLSADGGRKGILAFEGNADRIAFVVLDLMMPEMDGLAVQAALRAIRPDLPILFCTGYSAEALDADEQSGPSALLLKPFSLGDLEVAVADLLGKACPTAVG